MRFLWLEFKKNKKQWKCLIPETKETKGAIEAMKKAGWKLTSKEYFKNSKGEIDV